MTKYLSLAVRALALVVIAASLWSLAADAYDGAVVAAARGFLPEGVSARAGEGRIYLDFAGKEEGRGLGVDGSVLHFGVALVVALVAATPGLGLLQAVAWTAGFIGGFFVAHAAAVALYAQGLWVSVQGDGTGLTMGGVMAAFAIFWALLPAAVGGAWCYRRWLPSLRSSPAATRSA